MAVPSSTTHPIRWPNTDVGAETEWIDFIVGLDDVEYPIRYQLNVSWLLSKWQCQYGDCPGVLYHGAMTDVSCCQIGVEFESRADFTRVRKAVGQLTAEDWDLIGTKGSRSWYESETPEGKKTPVPKRTRVTEHGCIFANRHGGAAGRPGCALHHLAERTGQQKWDTKPDICWQIPMAVSWGWDAGSQCYWIRVDASTGTLWGWPDNGRTDVIGYWCTETPDAYNGREPVYKSLAPELRRILGDDGYEPIADKLDGLRRARAMPGELANGGRKMLPLLVADRVQQWQTAGDGPRASQETDDYLARTRTGRKAAQLLRSTQCG